MLTLIGMLDSPFVRRVAVALQQLQLPFEHRPVSVLRQVDDFKTINPLLKAPTLVTAEGLVLVESSLILDYAQSLAGRSLVPEALAQKAQALRWIGVSLVVCEKAVQQYLEKSLRPADKQFEPWLARVNEQVLAGLAALEQEWGQTPSGQSDALDLTGISLAVMWRFVTRVNPQIQPERYPRLAAWSQQAETLPVFQRAAFGDGTYPTA